MALYAFDGTWQDADKQPTDRWTNVPKFCDRYNATCKCIYESGPGTRFGLFGKMVGGGMGVGTNQRMHWAYADLRNAFNNGDRVIDIVGFSRGAATAFTFAWSLCSRRARKELGDIPEIRFLGLWDTVFNTMGTMGLPLGQQMKVWLGDRKVSRVLFFRGPGGADLTIPPIVKNVFHALALHERRISFRPVRIKRAWEVWFAGGHSDIGGGSDNTELSDTTLRWMLEKAAKCDVPIKTMVKFTRNQKPASFPDQLKWGHWEREVRQSDLIHPSVLRYGGESVEGVAGLGVEAED